MPKYVLKEDVQKGLVDPTRSLDEQPEYKKKIQHEKQEKEKHHEQKKHHQRPKKERPPRKQRPKFNWNKNDVTLETKAPEKPKKILEKPDAQKHKEGFQKLKAEREALKAARSAIFDEQRVVIRDINESKKYGREVNTQYTGVMREKMGWENQIRKEIRVLDDHKKKIYAEINQLKFSVEALRRPERNEDYSIQQIQQRIYEKEHYLTTSTIDKKQEARLSNEINDLKRALTGAKPYIELQSEINKISDQIQILYYDLTPIKQQLHIKITQANAIKAEIEGLKAQLKTEKGATPEQKTIEEVKAEYDVKIKAIDEKRDKLEERIDDYMDKNIRTNDEYEDQQDLLRFIEWTDNQIQRLKKKQEEDKKWQKQKEEREKKRLKEKEDYEKRQEERKKKDEERKKKGEEYKARLEKEREDFINRNPNHEIIDLCHGLIDYCQNLRRSISLEFEDPRNKAPGEIKFGKEWTKEIKGGAEIVVSKKSQKDEQVTNKKAVKPKKKQEKPENQNYEHGIQAVNQFQTIKLLPPNNASEIDSSIKLIKEKIELYNNATEEQKIAFKEKATKEWEERKAARDNQRDQRDQRRQGQGNYREKNNRDGDREEKEEKEEREPKREKKENPRRGKKQVNEGDFPELA